MHRNYFVQNFNELYGVQYISYNEHNLVHLSKDVVLFDPLDSYIVFKFENFLYKLKNKLCTGKNYLEQVSNKLYEEIQTEKKNEIGYIGRF